MAQAEEETSNALQFSVSELAAALKHTVEDRFGYVRVRGEIAGYRGPHASGHGYFTLKDENARLDAVIWRTALSRMRIKPQDGLEIIACGKISIFAGKSSYQIIIDTIELAGAGALMALLESRRLQLAKEGLFDAQRKRPLPFLPRVIGVITSPTGAVIRDILHRLTERFPTRVVVWPVRVQGEGSAEEIVAAIRGFNHLDPGLNVARPDVLIVARGGGALEDLWSFNEESVVRAAADSNIPIVSAVGHETDWTLLDHVADLRAPTPTAAAEICAPIRADLITRVAQLSARNLHALGMRIKHDTTALRSSSRGIPSPQAYQMELFQRLDATFADLERGIEASRTRQFMSMATFSKRLGAQSPSMQLAKAASRFRENSVRLTHACARSTTSAHYRIRDQIFALDRLSKHGFSRYSSSFMQMNEQWSNARAVYSQNMSAWRRQLDKQENLFLSVTQFFLTSTKNKFLYLEKLFTSSNYKSVLSRGYALLSNTSGNILTNSRDTKIAKSFIIQFADGNISASVRNSTKRKAVTNTEETIPKLLF